MQKSFDSCRETKITYNFKITYENKLIFCFTKVVLIFLTSKKNLNS